MESCPSWYWYCVLGLLQLVTNVVYLTITVLNSQKKNNHSRLEMSGWQLVTTDTIFIITSCYLHTWKIRIQKAIVRRAETHLCETEVWTQKAWKIGLWKVYPMSLWTESTAAFAIGIGSARTGGSADLSRQEFKQKHVENHMCRT